MVLDPLEQGTDCCEPLYGSWELNLGSLSEHPPESDKYRAISPVQIWAIL